MRITLEFTGLPRQIVGQKSIEFNLPENATYRDLVRRLAQAYPALLDLIIARDGETFLSSNMFVINGDLANPAMNMDESPQDGMHLILMSVITGG